MANPSVNKEDMDDNVSFSLVADTEKTIVLPDACRTIEIVNDDPQQDVYIAVGDRIATADTESRLMTSNMNSIIIESINGQTDQYEWFTEVSFLCDSNATVRLMNLVPHIRL